MGDPLERLGSEAAPVAPIGLESSMKDDLCMEMDPPLQENVASADEWRKALNKVVPAVVVLRTTACRAFDTEPAGVGSATGFVVDKRRGIILTNRHVVKPGTYSPLSHPMRISQCNPALHTNTHLLTSVIHTPSMN